MVDGVASARADLEPDGGQLAQLHERVRPAVLASDRSLSLHHSLGGLFPSGLQRGATVAVSGSASVSLALALAIGPSQAGGWVMTVGLPSLGLVAACEMGVALDRLVLIGAPPPRLWPDVIVTAAEGAEVVIAATPQQLRPADVRRVQARLARSQAALIVLGADPSGLQPDVRIATSHPRWEGIEQGAGRLLSRRIDVAVEGRRAIRPRRQTLLLPDAAGRAELAPGVAVAPSSDSSVSSIRSVSSDEAVAS